ncbi:MAG: pyrroline-5-carboxylate reductase dimerization domain-containing protein [bacterium]|nr:pyrroline-5-carboxylate reductase dimerization domain-containing protein [bacterium]
MKVCIIGFGVMGQAISRVLAKAKSVKKLSVIKKDSKVAVVINGIKKADYVIVAVKPQDVASLAEEVRGYLDETTTLISIVVGVSIQKLEKIFRHKKVVRAMPNLGLTVSQGIIAWRASKAVKLKEKSEINKFLNLIPESFMVNNEQDIDKVGAVSGSGPAYFFLLADAMCHSAVKLGLSKIQAERLVKKTFIAAAELQRTSDYSQLVKKIASKKGITEAAIKVFHKMKFDKTVESAIYAAHKRAKELNRG